MPRTIPANLQTHLNGYYQTLAFCVKLTRKDATVMGFTSHDKNLTISSQLYEAASAIDASAISQTVGAGVDNLDVMGLLQSAKITEADLRAGKYDGAAIEGFLVNWGNVADGVTILLKGKIGNVTVIDTMFTAEFRSLSQLYSQQVVEVTTPLCRVAQLGDARCKVNLASFQFGRTVTVVTDDHNVTFGADTHETGYYGYGRVIWLTGPNTGFVSVVKEHTLTGGTAVLELQEAPPYTMAVSDTATLEAGCDRRHETCIAKFANMVNFRGEPLLPGNTAITKVGRGS